MKDLLLFAKFSSGICSCQKGEKRAKEEVKSPTADSKVHSTETADMLGLKCKDSIKINIRMILFNSLIIKRKKHWLCQSLRVTEIKIIINNNLFFFKIEVDVLPLFTETEKNKLMF